MSFSDGLRVTSNELKWSPNGKYLAIPVIARLELRDGLTLKLLYNCNCADIIQDIEWSPNSNLVLTANFKKGIIQIWQPRIPSWKCKIDSGAAGLVNVSWAPDSVHVLTTSEFYIRMTIWSLANKSVSYIKNPKEASPGYVFSNDGEYLACTERKDCRDSISILETNTWHVVKNFEIATQDLAGLSISPDDSVLACWDSPAQYRVFIYMLNGQCLASFSAYDWALGVKSVCWSPDSQLLAIKSFDEKIRMMNNVTWSIVCALDHSPYIESSDCIVYKEVEEPLVGYPATLANVKGLPAIAATHYEEESNRPIKLMVECSLKIKTGCRSVQFSSDGRYLASIVESMPCVVFIWHASTFSLVSILVHTNAVKDMKWSPKRSLLAMACCGSHVYFWTPFGCLTIPVPNSISIQITSIKWHAKGSKLLLSGKDQFTTYDLNTQLIKICNDIPSNES